MDFTEDIEASPPCFLVPDSQKEDSVFTRSSSEHHAKILKQLAISIRTEFDRFCGKNDGSCDKSNKIETQLKVMAAGGSAEGEKETRDRPGAPSGAGDEGENDGGSSNSSGEGNDNEDDVGGGGGDGGDGGNGDGRCFWCRFRC